MSDDADDQIFTLDAAGLKEFLSTKEGVLNVIEQLRGRVSHRWRFETLKLYINALVELYGTHQSYSIVAQENRTLCRVRHWKLSEKPNYAKDLGAREPPKTDDYGRCHRPGHPLCYCSVDEDTALAEIGAEIDKRYVVATYRVTGDLIVLPIGELDWFRRTGFTHLGTAHSHSSEVYRQALDESDGNLKVLVDAFFADEFIKPANSSSDYRLTSALSNVLFGAKWNTPIDAIFYPSVAFRAGSNFAIRPMAVKDKLTLVKEQTKIIVVKDVLGYGIFETEKEAVLKSISAGGELVWDMQF